MKLISNLTATHERLYRMAETFGDPRLSNVVLEHDGQQYKLPTKPRLNQIDPRNIGKFLGSNIEILGDEEVITPLLRSALPEAVYSNATYLLDAQWNGTGWTGTRADLLWLDKSKVSTFTAYVSRHRGR